MEIVNIDTLSLRFDHQNPRLAEYGIESTTAEEEILRILWEEMDIMELVQSISASGFFPHEALIISEEAGQQIVIEGNRRLAAVKVILNDPLVKQEGWKIPPISTENRKNLKHSLVLNLTARKLGNTLASSMSTVLQNGAATQKQHISQKLNESLVFHFHKSPLR